MLRILALMMALGDLVWVSAAHAVLLISDHLLFQMLPGEPKPMKRQLSTTTIPPDWIPTYVSEPAGTISTLAYAFVLA